ncbi:hypothetical protein HY025_04835 [Candidatus Daviesbacteria bacterium]|nr:hypothetical protein [Candidatus Daviesbacteria bacterium]
MPEVKYRWPKQAETYPNPNLGYLRVHRGPIRPIVLQDPQLGRYVRESRDPLLSLKHAREVVVEGGGFDVLADIHPLAQAGVVGIYSGAESIPLYRLRQLYGENVLFPQDVTTEGKSQYFVHLDGSVKHIAPDFCTGSPLMSYLSLRGNFREGVLDALVPETAYGGVSLDETGAPVLRYMETVRGFEVESIGSILALLRRQPGSRLATY